jgi:hypothetical protein
MKVRVRPNRQMVTDAGHHTVGKVLELSEAKARQWIALGAVEPVGKVAEPETSSQRQGRANVAKRVAEELATNPNRSDREIAKVVGCDHKTVAKHRKSTASTTPPE